MTYSTFQQQQQQL